MRRQVILWIAAWLCLLNAVPALSQENAAVFKIKYVAADTVYVEAGECRGFDRRHDTAGEAPGTGESRHRGNSARGIESRISSLQPLPPVKLCEATCLSSRATWPLHNRDSLQQPGHERFAR